MWLLSSSDRCPPLTSSRRKALYLCFRFTYIAFTWICIRACLVWISNALSETAWLCKIKWLWYAGPPYIHIYFLSVQQCYLTMSLIRLAHTELIIICVSGYVRLCLYKWDRVLNAAGSDIPLRNETFHQGPGVGFCHNEWYLSLPEHNAEQEETGWLKRRVQSERGR